MYLHTCLFFGTTWVFFCKEEKKKKRCQPLFLSLFFPPPLGTHAPCIGCVVSPMLDSCTGWLSLRSPPCPHTRPYAPISHKSPSLDHLPLPNTTYTHIHILMSSQLLFQWLCPVVLELTLLFTLFPPLQFSVTTAVCQLSACPSLVKDKAETEGLQGRQPGLSVSPSCHEVSCFTTGSFPQTCSKVKHAPLIQQWNELIFSVWFSYSFG